MEARLFQGNLGWWNIRTWRGFISLKSNWQQKPPKNDGWSWLLWGPIGLFSVAFAVKLQECIVFFTPVIHLEGPFIRVFFTPLRNISLENWWLEDEIFFLRDAPFFRGPNRSLSGVTTTPRVVYRQITLWFGRETVMSPLDFFHPRTWIHG